MRQEPSRDFDDLFNDDDEEVCPRMLKACAVQLGEPLQHVFNLSLRLGRVPVSWETTCLIPVPKKAHPKELNDYRPVALTSHVMKTMLTAAEPPQTTIGLQIQLEIVPHAEVL